MFLCYNFSTMKFWVLVAALVVILPVHGQEKRSHPAPGQQNAKPESPVSRVVVVDQDNSDRQKDGAKDHPQGYFSRLFSPENLPNIGLFVAGVVGIVVAICTLKAIGKQADHMERQTGILKKSVAAAEANAEAAKANAEAANRGIEIMIGKERARIRVEVADLELDEPVGEFSLQQVKYKVFSYGAVAAFISKSTALVEISDSEEPPHSTVNPPASLPAVLYPNIEGVDKHALLLTALRKEDIDGIHEGKSFIHLRGSIKYGDVFASERETRFKYVWKSSGYSNFFASYRGYWIKTEGGQDNVET